MYAVTGITGQVGGAVARTLLAKDCGVRASFATPTKQALGQNKDARLQ